MGMVDFPSKSYTLPTSFFHLAMKSFRLSLQICLTKHKYEKCFLHWMLFGKYVKKLLDNSVKFRIDPFGNVLNYS